MRALVTCKRVGQMCVPAVLVFTNRVLFAALSVASSVPALTLAHADIWGNGR